VEFAAAWKRLLVREEVAGLGAKVNGKLVGIAHYVFHASTWAQTVCYLQDLFTSPALRSKGVARSLIEAVAAEARTRGAVRYYWLTQEHNAVARRLYDKIGKHNGFIRYDYDL
jgi:GNAT superfamily N-acetyltransferase